MSFSGLQIARRALSAHQSRLSVISQNIANSSTEGYSRQTVTLRTVPGSMRPGGSDWLGGGVEVASVQRQRDDFIDALLRQESGRTEYWGALSEGWQRLESIMQEPAGSGISDQLTQFWDAWRQLAALPDSMPSRSALVEQAKSLIQEFQQIDDQLSGYRTELGGQIDATVRQVNSLAEQVAKLNESITRSGAGGRSTTSLSDQRDLLIDQLSDLAGAEINTLEDGTLQVVIGSKALVDGNQVHPVLSVADGSGGRTIAWEDTGTSAAVGGRISGYMEFLNSHVPALQDRITETAKTLSEQVNAVHQGGFDLQGGTGTDFFVLRVGPPFSIGQLQVNPALEADGSLVAASQSGEVGDGNIALQLANLGDKDVFGGASIMQYHRETLAELGVASAATAQVHQNQALIVEDLSGKRDAVSGVNLDEELTSMIEAEHAYQAAARVIDAMDGLLDVVVNDLGMAGH